MKILVANNHLEKVGGSETFTYALIEELLERGYTVEYFTFFKGIVSSRIENDLKVSFMNSKKYDLILANHNTCVRFLSRKGILIQTCHGIFPKEEQPDDHADGHVAISKEVAEHLKSLEFPSKMIHNGINCERYQPKKPIHTKLQNVLSLSQSEIANAKIQEACKKLNLNFSKLNKNTNPVWNVEDLINEADLVLGLGRSAFEAMACGRATVVFDERAYSKSYADGYMTPELIDQCIVNNCSGRYSKKEFDTADLIHEFSHYKSDDGALMRAYALTHFNIKLQVEEYLSYSKSLTKKKSKIALIIISWYQLYRMYQKKRKIRRKRNDERNN